jgi:PfaD family protein
MQQIHAYRDEILIGAAGGIATPHSVCAAMAMGADYVVTGSINQACVQASTSQAVKQMLAAAQQADMAMAPAADMFEMGIKVQVLKRGTMFAMRAQKLYEAYRSYDAIDQLPEDLKRQFETQFFRQPLDEVWGDTQAYFTERDPDLLERARKNEKLKMALIFRSYLGRASNWANAGEKTRSMDYQVWCGPAMAALNAWTRGSFMELPENRCAVLLGQNLMAGALALTRANMIKTQGLQVSESLLDLCVRPKTWENLNAITAVTLNKESKD